MRWRSMRPGRYLAPLNPDSEIYLIPKIGGGWFKTRAAPAYYKIRPSVSRFRSVTVRPTQFPVGKGGPLFFRDSRFSQTGVINIFV